MMSFLADYGLFLLKSLTVLIVVVGAVMLVVGIVIKVRRGDSGSDDDGRIEITRYNDRLDDLKESLSLALLEPAERKQAAKAMRKREKEEAKAAKKAAKAAAKVASKTRGKGETLTTAEDARARVFVLDFDGDIRATAVDSLRREITAVLTTATSGDEIVVRLESGGGVVTGYGLAGSQLDRIRKHGTPLTVCVDKIAASGGYMMACVADRLVAAPFAVLGSIGVVAQIPNFHRLLKEHNIDVELLTAGKFKRTLTLFGENTEEGREKFLQDIERIHAQFKAHVGTRRPALDMERVSTGEVWSGEDALELHLADRLATSDEYLVEACAARDVMLVTFRAKKKGMLSRISVVVDDSVDRLALRWIERFQSHPYR